MPAKQPSPINLLIVGGNRSMADAAQGCVPVAADPYRGRARPSLREHHREEPRNEDPEQAEEDEEVRRVPVAVLVGGPFGKAVGRDHLPCRWVLRA